MAAYAALVSVMQIIHQLENHHSPPISLDKQQVESLTEKVNLLQEFLERYDSPFGYSDEADPLEMRIADAAYAAEDVIESYIVDNIKLAVQIAAAAAAAAAYAAIYATASAAVDDDAADYDNEISYITFYEDVQKVIEEMELITREVTEMVGKKDAVEAQLQRSVVSRDAERKSVMVGFEDLLLELLERLTGGKSSRQIIPIVGMGGIGKTTLAMNVFGHPLIKEHFDICVWATISQDYDIRATLAEVLSQVRGNSVEKDETELGEKIYKILFGRKYLVIMDDMWSLDVWDKMNFFFPDYNNGSRVLVTTRLSDLATHLTDRNTNSLINVKSLDEVNSWTLFSKTVFGEESNFPRELEKIGEKIVSKCNGHPLAIVVIGGLLAKSQHTQEYWEHIEGNLISIVNSESNEYCLRILRMSYNNLPVSLKPCFLYMGMFEEDRSIKVSTLVNLWVCEGFVKPRNNKSLETIGEEYFKELIDRNLILVDKLGSIGNIKYCKIHDLLRDVCLKEAKKQRFYYAIRDEDSGPGIESQRRFTIRKSAADINDIGVLGSSLHARSFLSDERQVFDLFPEVRLLRILSTIDKNPWGTLYRLEDVFRYVNSRYLGICVGDNSYKISSSINLLWNLHTLIISTSSFPHFAPVEIWKMHHLRHVVSSNKVMFLPDPPSTDNDIVIMENLQTLKGLYNFNLNEEVVERIPNIKKLYVCYDREQIERVNCLSYLECLSKLETFRCLIRKRCAKYLQKISFPHSLKKLKLGTNSFGSFGWEAILQKIGSLPLLQKFTLEGGFFGTRKWETIEGQFRSLKVLELSECGDLEEWTVSESSHFPLLQELRLERLDKLEEIPSEIGELSTLKSIVLKYCSRSMMLSAKKIVEELEDLHGEQPDLHVRVVFPEYREAHELEYLASPNFHLDFSS